jgi:hypothetical protein
MIRSRACLVSCSGARRPFRPVCLLGELLRNRSIRAQSVRSWLREVSVGARLLCDPFDHEADETL